MKDILWKVKKFDQLTLNELYCILKIRQEVFIVEQACYYLDADGCDDQAVHLWAERNGEILAYCRVFDEGVKYWESSIGRVLTGQKFRNLKLGKVLMKFALEVIESRFKSKRVRISAQDYLIKFYTEFGFSETGKKYFEDDIPHTEMYRQIQGSAL